jgi:oligopeptide/dipeptide ABC transporter ATP-binding protein
MPSDVLVADNLVKQYGPIRAVDDVSLTLSSGRTLALVGESGSGKSTMAKMLGYLERPTAGTIELDGSVVPRRVRRQHRQQVQMVFQDPFASLNPVHTIGYHVARSLLLHDRCTRAEVAAVAALLLDQVNLSPGAEFLTKLPHQLSGGQRQRAAIAAALAVGPRVLLADEPVSMLDVSIRVDILTLLRRLVAEQDLAMLYITHDIASARYFADDIAVLYKGRVVERGDAATIVESPQHPYTQLLIAAAPRGGRSRGASVLPQTSRSAAASPARAAPQQHCAFAPRCPKVLPRCTNERPPEIATSDSTLAACWLHARPEGEPS